MRSRNLRGAFCIATPFASNDNQYGGKGEGLQPRNNPNFDFARGKIASGGGGGNHHNGGGGGGANFSAGGEGGQGWNGGQPTCPAGNAAGGLGGEALASFIGSNRLFLGGGGGGGQQNNSRASNGGAGGGLVFLRAQAVATTGPCAGLRSSANGETAADGGNDGMGGGGAGGTVVLQIPQFSIDPNCALAVPANGGDGGTVNNRTHGGGGGGGQGVVLYTIPQPADITTNTLNGIGGCNNNSNPCNNQAGSGVGPNNVGIIANTILPLNWSYFEGRKAAGDAIALQWGATITGSGWLTLERSPDGVHFEALYSIEATAPSGTLEHFDYLDQAPLSGSNYYRLHWLEHNGTALYSNLIFVELPIKQPDIVVYPNPAQDYLHIKTTFQNTTPICELLDMSGRQIAVPVQLDGMAVTLSTAALPRGVYLLRIRSEAAVKTVRVILR